MRRITLLLAALAALLAMPAAAHASANQESLFQDDDLLVYNTPDGVGKTLDNLASMGVDRIRVSVFWSIVAPGSESQAKPAGFDGSDPAAYPEKAWDRYDTVVREAGARGIAVNFDITSPAPNWATGNPARADIDATYDPSAEEFGAFVRAVGTRYSGSYNGLPRVASWGLWNEPNQPGWLTPQWVPDPRAPSRWVEHAPGLYRGLADAAYAALAATGHGSDTILVGETAPKGLRNNRGETRAIDALRFIRTLYCLDAHLQFLRGSAATVRGCPESDQAKRFPAEHPALFRMSGYAHHPYELIFAPNRRPTSKDWATIANLGDLTKLLRRVYARYGQPLPAKHGRQMPLYLTEFGYQTNPPDPTGVSWAQQAKYLDQSEFIAWRNPTVRMLNQFLLRDDQNLEGFQSGLQTFDNQPKPSLARYRLPVWLPSRPSRAGRLRVWGFARAAANGSRPTVLVQARRGRTGAWRTVRTVSVRNRRGYFVATFLARASGAVRLAWTSPSGEVVLSREAGFRLRGRR